MSFEESVLQDIKSIICIDINSEDSAEIPIQQLPQKVRDLIRERDNLKEQLLKANFSTDDQNKAMGEIEFILRNEAIREGRGSEGVPLPLNRMTEELQELLKEKINLGHTVADKNIALCMVEERVIYWSNEVRKYKEEVESTLSLFPKEYHPSGPALHLSEYVKAYIEDVRRDHETALATIQGLQVRLNQEQSEAHISGQMIREAFDVITKHRKELGIPEESGPYPLSESLESFIHDCKELKGPEGAGAFNRLKTANKILRQEVFDAINSISYQVCVPPQIENEGLSLRESVGKLIAAYRSALGSNKDFEKAFMDKRKEVEEARDILFATGLVEWSPDFTLPKALRKVLDSLEEKRRTDPFKEGPCEQALSVIWEYLAEDTHADPNRSESPSSIAAAVGCRLREKRDAIYHRDLYKSSLEHIKERISREISWTTLSMEENLERLILQLKIPQSSSNRVKVMEKKLFESRKAWGYVADSLKSLLGKVEKVGEEGNG